MSRYGRDKSEKKRERTSTKFWYLGDEKPTALEPSGKGQWLVLRVWQMFRVDKGQERWIQAVP